jgi:polysaccharide export outer membrane protein
MLSLLRVHSAGVAIVCTLLSTPGAAQTSNKPQPPAATTAKPQTPPAATTAKPQAPPAPTTAKPANAPPPPVAGVATPPGYIIGPDDLLSVRFYGDTSMSADVVVRPDGKISVSLLNDVQAAGLTPEQLNDALEKAASKFVTDPDVTVIVREVRSRKVYVIGQVAKPTPIPLNTDMTVLQALATVGGLLEYADKGNIIITREENGKQQRFRFNYNEVLAGKNLQQNIQLKPGDTILVK